MNTLTETHTRTLLKTVIYRIACTLGIIALSYALSGSGAQSMTMGAVIFVLGTIIYYGYDRVWSAIGWKRSSTGDESVFRSVTKTIGYRIITIIIAMILARLILTDNNATAASFAIGQFIINLVLYYILERIFNRVGYGKVVMA